MNEAETTAMVFRRDDMRSTVHSDPKLFEPFEIGDIDDPKLGEAMAKYKGSERGDLIYIIVDRPVPVPKDRPDIVALNELLISMLLRWDGERWFMVAPHTH